jgi:hypothetical protein
VTWKKIDERTHFWQFHFWYRGDTRKIMRNSLVPELIKPQNKMPFFAMEPFKNMIILLIPTVMAL